MNPPTPEPYSVTLTTPASTGLPVAPSPTPTPTSPHSSLAGPADGAQAPGDTADLPLVARLWKGWWDIVTNEADYLAAVEHHQGEGPPISPPATEPSDAMSAIAIMNTLQAHVELVVHSVTLSLQVVKAIDWDSA